MWVQLQRLQQSTVNGLCYAVTSLHHQRRSCSVLYHARRYERFSHMLRKPSSVSVSVGASKADFYLQNNK